MKSVTFVRFALEHYALYAAWSADEEINRWLGDPTQEWLDYVLTTTQSFTWMIYENDTPVAHLQVDRLEDDFSQAQVTLMIAPQLRRQGYGRHVLTSMLEQPELIHVTRFYAFIKPANIASVELFRHVGYQPVSPEPSDNGYVEYEFQRG